MAEQSAPPALSTSATHIFEEQPAVKPEDGTTRLSDEQLYITYEIERTLSEIRKERYKRVALQFPDGMLPDAPRVFDALSKGLRPDSVVANTDRHHPPGQRELADGLGDLNVSPEISPAVRLYILGDTSYGACCVDEVAAEHIDADAIIHYGRACLSPTSRIPVLHVFTIQPLQDQARVTEDFVNLFKDKQQKIILMADVTYQHHLQSIAEILQTKGFSSIYMTNIIHNPSSPLPNRTIPEEVKTDLSTLKEYNLFHISSPPDSLLLTLSSRVGSMHIYPTSPNPSAHQPQSQPSSSLASPALALSRRYALLTSITTVPVIGILINTLSVANYLSVLTHLKFLIRAAGKKSYTFVVGKVNAAKVANFSDVGAWVVVGCWESSLIDSKDFWRPVLTPFELELALKGDSERVWTGEWRGDFQGILDGSEKKEKPPTHVPTDDEDESSRDENADPTANDAAWDSEPESAPPEFDLRTGCYVSQSRPMQAPGRHPDHTIASSGANHSLVRRARGDVAVVGGEISPAAEYLRSKRTWKGLGSDFEIAYEADGGAVEEGRSGIARGYKRGGEGGRA